MYYFVKIVKLFYNACFVRRLSHHHLLLNMLRIDAIYNSTQYKTLTSMGYETK